MCLSPASHATQKVPTAQGLHNSHENGLWSPTAAPARPPRTQQRCRAPINSGPSSQRLTYNSMQSCFVLIEPALLSHRHRHLVSRDSCARQSYPKACLGMPVSPNRNIPDLGTQCPAPLQPCPSVPGMYLKRRLIIGDSACSVLRT